jgi:hypothetical protein
MGKRGPAPKAEADRLRQNADYKPSTYVQAGEIVEPPHKADETWHPQAIAIYESYSRSAQAHLFEESDWAKVYLMCEAISRELKPQFIGFSETVNPDTGMIEKKPLQAKVPIKGATLNAVGQWMTTLLTTEADRRRANVEIRRTSEAPEQSAGEAAVASLREAMVRRDERQREA